MADIVGMEQYLAFIMAFLAVFAIVFIAIYIYAAIVLMVIARKTNTPNGWLAWIPIANIYLMLTIAKLPWWWIFAIFVGLIPFIGSMALMAGAAYVWWKIAEARKFPGWYGILMIIPLVNFVIMGIIAWKEP